MRQSIFVGCDDMLQKKQALSRFYIEPKDRWYYLLLLPTMVVLLAVNIYPLLYSVYVSLTNYKLTSASTPDFVGLQNYISLVQNPDFLKAMLNTLIYVLFAVSIEIVLGLAIAMLLYRLGKAGNYLLSAFLLPMMLTPVIIGIMWRFMYNYDFGMINAFISSLGFAKYTFLSNKELAIIFLAMVDIWQWTPYAVLLLFGSLQSLPKDQLEAGSIDGANAFTIFRKITLPFLSQTLTICILIRMIDSIKEYDKVYTMTQGGPGNATETASFFIYRQAFKFFNTAEASAASIILLVITVVVSNMFLKRMRKNEYKN